MPPQRRRPPAPARLPRLCSSTTDVSSPAKRRRCSALLLNALKTLAGIDDDVHLISPTIIEPIQKLKTEHLGNRNPRLHTDEILIALSICAATDARAARAMAALAELAGCEVHSSVILSQVDSDVFKKLGVNLTCEPVYQTKKLYHK